MEDIQFMQLAIEEAKRALDHDDVPVGAIVVIDDKIIGRRHNEREKQKDPTAHAEVLALRDAAAFVGSWHLEQATLYVTLEPCAMCAGALVNARLGRLVYGATDPKAGAVYSLYEIPTDSRLNHRVEVLGGICENECGMLLRDFFAARR